MMTAFLNGRYIYKNINPTTSKDDVIIMRYIYTIVIVRSKAPPGCILSIYTPALDIQPAVVLMIFIVPHGEEMAALSFSLCCPTLGLSFLFLVASFLPVANYTLMTRTDFSFSQIYSIGCRYQSQNAHGGPCAI